LEICNKIINKYPISPQMCCFFDSRCTNTLYFQTLESFTYISAPDSMGLRLLLFTISFLKGEPLSLKLLARILGGCSCMPAP